MTIREALPEEIYEPFEHGFVAIEREHVDGHVAVSMLHGHPWIHALRYWGSNAFGATALMARARAQVKALGFSKAYLNIAEDAKAMEPAIERFGGRKVQTIYEVEF